MHYTAAQIAAVIAPTTVLQLPGCPVHFLLTDSRQVVNPSSSLFFALQGPFRNGNLFIEELYESGVRNFVVHEHATQINDANFFVVADVLLALQQLATHHRNSFQIPVIGITGSNGKTVVKEWLYQLLQTAYTIVRSPKSYNSQLGVPLSVWEMNDQHTMAIFEAGISTTGEMKNLQKMIRPSIGVLTNIGAAHDAGFSLSQEKLKEKLLLFSEADVVILPFVLSKKFSGNVFTWGEEVGATLQIISTKKNKSQTEITLLCNNQTFVLLIPFTDEAAMENAVSCCAVLLHLGIEPEKFLPRFQQLHAVDMRLQLKHAINNCLVVNDSYSADLTSLKIALNFLQQQSSSLNRTVIISDFVDTGRSVQTFYASLAMLLRGYAITKIIAIGVEVGDALSLHFHDGIVQAYSSTEAFINSFKSSSFHKEIILIKGARKFAFERIAQQFETKLHQTVLQVNLNALAHNLKEYQKILQPHTRVMAMVKAFAYGSGGAEIASVLQQQHVHFLGVAYADEGVELRKAGISLPVMVMNAEQSSFAAIVDNNLQPVLFSFALLQQFENYVSSQGLQHYPVHIEIETGMNRLGFVIEDVQQLAKHLCTNKLLQVQSVFSHLAASDDEQQDEYTSRQANVFNHAIIHLEKELPYTFLRHIANSAAAVRHPHLQMSMVRLGIGMYGIEMDTKNLLQLQPVATLRSTIAQIKHVDAGSSVSYNRSGVVHRPSAIATVRIGYADGYSRRFGNGVGKMLVNKKLVPVIGAVCMDMTMIDVTDIPGVQEGDEVFVFGEGLRIQEIAKWINTIPYEIMTSVSARVKRVYFW